MKLRTAREVAAVVRLSGACSPELAAVAVAAFGCWSMRVGRWAELLADNEHPGVALALLLWTADEGEW